MIVQVAKRAWAAAAVLAVVFAATGFAFPASADAGKRLERPNIVVVLTDDQPYESLAHMPHVSRRSDWIRFDNAFLNNPICCPSRASILNGRYSHQNRVETNLDGREFNDRQSIAVWLQTAGYRTGFFGKYLNGYPWERRDGLYVPRGWTQWLAFNRMPSYYGYELNKRGNRKGNAERVTRGSLEKDYSTDLLARKATRFVGRASRRSRPFLAFLSFYAPHGPASPAPRHEGAFAGTEITHPPSFNEQDVSDKPAWIQELPLRDPEQMAESRRAQYRMLLAVDEAVRGLFAQLRDVGALRNTVVIFLSDNGFLWGEHRDIGKACGYEECVRTPLLIRVPGIEGRAEDALVSNVDLAPTIARFAGLRPWKKVDGRNLRKLLRGTKERVRRHVLLRGRQASPATGVGQPASFWGVRSERFKYIETPDTGEVELYDLAEDPFELENVAGRPAYGIAQSDLDAELDLLRGFPDD